MGETMNTSALDCTGLWICSGKMNTVLPTVHGGRERVVQTLL